MAQRRSAGRQVGAVLHILGYIAVFGLTATCTFLLFSKYAPPGVLWVPFLALALVEYGTYKWWHYAKYNAENLYQLLIAIGLGVASIIGILSCTGIEMASWFGIDIASNWQQVAFIYIIVLAVLQVVGFIGVGIVSNKNLSHWSNLGLGQYEEDRVLFDAGQAKVIEAEPSNKMPELPLTPDTGEMPVLLKQNGNIKKKASQAGNTQTN